VECLCKAHFRTSGFPCLLIGVSPKRKLHTGALMPATRAWTAFGSDRVSAESVAQAVSGGLDVDYRHFDCASVYGNEDRIGQVLEDFPANSFGLRPNCGTTSIRKRTLSRRANSRCLTFCMDYLDMYSCTAVP